MKKKNFLRKLALVLSMALTVSAVAPAAVPASAAAAPAFRSKAATLKVGESKRYNIANSGAYAITRVVVGTGTIASARRGGTGSGATKFATITGKKAGKTAVRAELKNYATKKTTSVRIPVTVATAETGLVAVTQTHVNKLSLTFGSADGMKDLSKEDVAIIRRGDNQRIYVREITADNDKKTLTVETILDMTDSNVFDITVGSITKVLNATDGVVADLKINTQQIQFDKPVMIHLLSTDSKGVVLADMEYNNIPGSYEFNIDTTGGYIDSNNKLVLTAVGNVAKVTGVYHTFKWDSDGNEIGKIQKEFTVTAVERAVVGKVEKYTILNQSAVSTSIDWNSVAINNEIVLNDSGSNYFYMLAKDSAGDNAVNPLPDPAYYTMTSSNEDIFFVTGQNQIVPNKVGSAYIVVKNMDGGTVWTMPVVIKAEWKAKVLEVSRANVSVTNSSPVAASVSVGLTVKDNYGRTVNGITEADYEVNCVSAPGSVNRSTMENVYFKEDGASVVFYGTKNNAGTNNTGGSVEAGSYTYQVKLTKDGANVIKTVVVSVQTPTNASSITYRLIVEGSDTSYTCDTAVVDGSTGNQEITVKLGEYWGGILQSYVPITSGAIASFRKTDGSNAVTSAAISTDVVGNVIYNDSGDGSVIFAARFVDGDKKVTKTSTGTYVLEVKNPRNNTLTTIKQNIIVKDSTPALTFVRRSGVSYTDKQMQQAAMSVYQLRINGTNLKYVEGAVSLNTLANDEISDTSVIGIDRNPQQLTGSNYRSYIKSINVYVPVIVGSDRYNVPATVSIGNFVEHAADTTK